MCLIVLAWRAREDLPLVVGANRDEWRARPTQAAHWWPDHPGLYAGRDLEAGGTWMGVTRGGRFAAITNFRDPSDRRTTAPSRGGLVTEFLLSAESPEAFLRSLATRAAPYNGFNLIAGDGKSLWCLASREDGPREIAPGVHGLSNHVLDEPWPKVVGAREAMSTALGRQDPEHVLEAYFSRTDTVADAHLPRTGVSLEWERRLSPPLITGEDYGTRSTSFITMDARGEIRLRELTRDSRGIVVSATDNQQQRRVA